MSDTKHPCEICPLGDDFANCYGCAFNDWNGEECRKYECRANYEGNCLWGVSGLCKARHPEDFVEEDEEDE